MLSCVLRYASKHALAPRAAKAYCCITNHKITILLTLVGTKRHTGSTGSIMYHKNIYIYSSCELEDFRQNSSSQAVCVAPVSYTIESYHNTLSGWSRKGTKSLPDSIIHRSFITIL